MFLAVLTGCSGSSAAGGPTGPPTSPPGEPLSTLGSQFRWVHATRGFDESPLHGELRLLPPQGHDDWTYSVDLDGDLQPDEIGPLRLGASILYGYQGVGPHEIGVRLERGGEEYKADRTVVVNDPAATRVAAMGQVVDDGGGWTEEIAHDPDDDTIYVLDRSLRLLVRLDGSTLEALETEPLPGTGWLEGMAVDFDQNVAYVLFPHGIAAYSLADSISFRNMVFLEEDLYGTLTAGPGGSLYHVGRAGLRRIDPDLGLVRAEADAWTGPVSFDLAGERLVHVAASGRTVSILDPVSLASLLRFEVPDGLPSPVAAAFHPAGDHLYVLLGRGEWRLLVIRLADLEIVRDVVLGQETNRSSLYDPGRTSPAAISFDGRFVVFSTGLGAFFVRTSDHLPLYRTMDARVDPGDVTGGDPIGCCNVVASPTSPVYWFSNRARSRVARVEFTR